MRRKIRRKSPLAKRTQIQVENLLTSSIPPQMQEVLVNLQKNLQEVHGMIDRQLHQTRELSARAYADLNAPGLVQENALDSATPELGNLAQTQNARIGADDKQSQQQPQPAAMTAIEHKLGEMNHAINQKFARMTQQIATRSQQVSAHANAMQAYAQQADAAPDTDDKQ